MATGCLRPAAAESMDSRIRAGEGTVRIPDRLTLVLIAVVAVVVVIIYHRGTRRVQVAVLAILAVLAAIGLVLAYVALSTFGRYG
jgi:hypothetical protein